jgi:hypothetical protein
MAKASKSTKKLDKALTRLQHLPRLNELVIEGGKRPLGVFFREHKQTVQPQIILWVDSATGFVRGMQLVNPADTQDDGISEGLESLVKALTGPFMALPIPAAPDDNGKVVSLEARRTSKKNSAKKASDFQLPQPGLPARIRINDPALAEAATQMLASYQIPVEYQETLPAFDQVFAALSEQIGTGDPEAAPPEPFEWEIEDESVLPPLFKAAASLWRRQPWEYMPGDIPLAIMLDNHGPDSKTKTLYASIMGSGGIVTGAAFYFSAEAYKRTLVQGQSQNIDDEKLDELIEMLRQAGAPVDGVPPDVLREMVGQIAGPELGLDSDEDAVMKMEDSLVVYFDASEEVDPTYLEWLAEHKLKSASREAIPTFHRIIKGSGPRPMNPREVKALTMALEALNQFFSTYRFMLEEYQSPGPGGFQHTAYVGEAKSKADRTPVEVIFPAKGYERDYVEYVEEARNALFYEEEAEAEAPEEPPSLAALTTLYRFQVKLDWKKSVWRRIEMRGDQTLHDLHSAIQAAFDWDNDHLYAFFLSGKAWDQRTAYESPYSEEGRSASRYRLENLPLQPKQQFLYIFDFGDELRHQVKLEAIIPGGVVPGKDYPLITEVHGDSVPQYGYEDEDDEE